METRKLTMEISEDGSIHLAGTNASFFAHSRGYKTVQFKLHHLVVLAFHGPPPTGMTKPIVHHIDGDPHNNAAGNLEWLSQAENTRRHFKGRPRLLTPQDVATIVRMKPPVSISLTEMAATFGVSVSCLRAIRTGRAFSGKAPSNRAILTPEQVQVVRDWQPAQPTAPSVARLFKVSKTVILNIWNGRY